MRQAKIQRPKEPEVEPQVEADRKPIEEKREVAEETADQDRNTIATV